MATAQGSGTGRRLVALAVAAVLAALLGLAIFSSLRSAAPTSAGLVAVEGRSGSEKVPFFEDARTESRFSELGFAVDAREAGSREIPTDFDLSTLDFSFPSGSGATRKIEAEAGPTTHEVVATNDVFFSPMVIASWEPIAEILVANGLAEDQGGWYTFDVAAYLDLLAAGTRWNELEGNAAFGPNKQVLIRSTDFRRSNSAAMYSAILAYTANGDQVLTSTADVNAVASEIRPAFVLQGDTPDSTQEMFEDYLVKGMGFAPMAMIYEAQFLSEAFRDDSIITDDMVLLYPTPTVLSQHTVVSHTEEGRSFAAALDDDEALSMLAAEYGFRGADDAHFEQLRAEFDVAVPDLLTDVVEPPEYDFLEGLIVELDRS